MTNLLETNCNYQFYSDLYTDINRIKQKIAIIGSLDNISVTKLTERAKIVNNFSKIESIIAFYHFSFHEQRSEFKEQFYQGYHVGKQCNLVLYDASQIPVQQVKKALELDANETLVSPDLLGIQIGWRLAVIEQTLSRFFPEQTNSYL